MSPQTAELKNAGAKTTRWDRLVLGAAIVGSVAFVAAFAFPYLALNQQAFGPYWPRRGWLLLHLAGGAASLLLGPFVLGLGLNRQRMALHRNLGIGYMAGVALGSIGAFYLAFHTDVSWVFGMGLTGLGIAWVATTGMALIAIKRRLITQHKEWMIRSYVVTFAFVTFRILAAVLEVAGVGTPVERLDAASWFCWAAPLLITEVILQGRKVFAASSPWE